MTVLRFSVAAVSVTVGASLCAATMPDEREASTQETEAISGEFMKGFRAIDTDELGSTTSTLG